MAKPGCLNGIAICDCANPRSQRPWETPIKFFGGKSSRRHRGQVHLLPLYRAREGWLEARARMFFYGGEDPATGSAAGCAASWMVQHGVAKNDEVVVIRQGVECRRPSEILVRATREGEHVTNVRVGGYAVEIFRGTVGL